MSKIKPYHLFDSAVIVFDSLVLCEPGLVTIVALRNNGFTDLGRAHVSQLLSKKMRFSQTRRKVYGAITQAHAYHTSKPYLDEGEGEKMEVNEVFK